VDDRFTIDAKRAAYLPSPGHALTLYNDAAVDPNGGGAFADIAKAIDDAQHLVFMAAWSFHPLARLEPKSDCIGNLLIKKARTQNSTGLLIAIHTWNHTYVGAKDQENDYGAETLRELSGGKVPSNLLWRMSSRTGEGGGAGFGWSHHQKFVLVDAPAHGNRRMLIVFFGGLDITKGRFDWPTHANLPEDRTLAKLREAQTFGSRSHDDWYNLEFADNGRRMDCPRQTWHDVHARLTGPAAWDFAREFVGRWFSDPMKEENPERWEDRKRRVREKFLQLFKREVFVQQWEPSVAKSPWTAQVVRSIVSDQWTSDKLVQTPTSSGGMRDEFKWTIDNTRFEASIQAAYLQWISLAERFIYIETQYLIGSGGRWGRNGVTNRVPETLVQRIIDQKKQNKPFHVYIVFPLFPEGSPTDEGDCSIRHLQWRTVEYMIRAIADEVGESWTKYLSFYFLAQWCDNTPPATGADRTARVIQAKRYQIYVHAKLMICDDHHLILGSCNLNERGLAGTRDTEICVGLSPTNRQLATECEAQVQAFRKALWTEHLTYPGQSSERALAKIPWQHPESPECAYAVQLAAATNYENFRAGKKRAESGHLCRWPISVDRSGKLVWSTLNTARTPQAMLQALEHALIPDHTFAFSPTGASVRSVMVSNWCIGPLRGFPSPKGLVDWDLVE
jgi:phospholipase D1/2